MIVSRAPRGSCLQVVSHSSARRRSSRPAVRPTVASASGASGTSAEETAHLLNGGELAPDARRAGACCCRVHAGSCICAESCSSSRSPFYVSGVTLVPSSTVCLLMPTARAPAPPSIASAIRPWPPWTLARGRQGKLSWLFYLYELLHELVLSRTKVYTATAVRPGTRADTAYMAVGGAEGQLWSRGPPWAGARAGEYLVAKDGNFPSDGAVVRQPRPTKQKPPASQMYAHTHGLSGGKNLSDSGDSPAHGRRGVGGSLWPPWPALARRMTTCARRSRRGRYRTA